MNTLYTEWPTSALYNVLHFTNINVLYTAEACENVALDWSGASVARNFSGPWDLLRGWTFVVVDGRDEALWRQQTTSDTAYSAWCHETHPLLRAMSWLAEKLSLPKSWLPVSVSFSTYTVTLNQDTTISKQHLHNEMWTRHGVNKKNTFLWIVTLYNFVGSHQRFRETC